MVKKFSEMDLAFVKQYLRIEPTFTADDEIIEQFMQAAHDYVVNTSGMTLVELDATNVPVVKYLRLVKQEYSGYGVTNDKGNIDSAYQMLANSLWSGNLS